MVVIIMFVGSMVWIVVMLEVLSMLVGKNFRLDVLECSVSNVLVGENIFGSVIML